MNKADFSVLGSAKLQVSSLLLDQEQGYSAASQGAVAPGSRFDPDRIAGRYRRLPSQPPSAGEHG